MNLLQFMEVAGKHEKFSREKTFYLLDTPADAWIDGHQAVIFAVAYERMPDQAPDDEYMHLYALAVGEGSWWKVVGDPLVVLSQPCYHRDHSYWTEAKRNLFYLGWIQEWMSSHPALIAKGVAKATAAQFTGGCQRILSGLYGDGWNRYLEMGWQPVLAKKVHPFCGDYQLKDIVVPESVVADGLQLIVTCRSAGLESRSMGLSDTVNIADQDYTLVALRKEYIEHILDLQRRHYL